MPASAHRSGTPMVQSSEKAFSFVPSLPPSSGASESRARRIELLSSAGHGVDLSVIQCNLCNQYTLAACSAKTLWATNQGWQLGLHSVMILSAPAGAARAARGA